jgi:hypothetical protein
MTIEQAKQLKSGDMVHHVSKLNADKTPMRAKVTSVKTWKTRQNQIEVHVKRGMYEYAVFNERELDQIDLGDK